MLVIIGSQFFLSSQSQPFSLATPTLFPSLMAPSLSPFSLISLPSYFQSFLPSSQFQSFYQASTSLLTQPVSFPSSAQPLSIQARPRKNCFILACFSTSRQGLTKNPHIHNFHALQQIMSQPITTVANNQFTLISSLSPEKIYNLLSPQGLSSLLWSNSFYVAPGFAQALLLK